MVLLSLPCVILTEIASCVTFVDHLRVEQCSKSLAAFVRSAGPLWVEIDFEMSGGAHEHLSDAQLARLLVRVNAHAHTRVLSLRGCVNLRGEGLAPLMNRAKTLEIIDLRGPSTTAFSRQIPTHFP